MSTQDFDILKNGLLLLSKLASIKNDPVALDIIKQLTPLVDPPLSNKESTLKEIENELHIEGNFLYQVLENMPVGIFCRNQDQQVIFWSQECSKIFHVPAEQALSRTCDEIFEGQTATEISSQDKLHFQNKFIEYELLLQHPTRTIKLIKQPFISDNGHFISITICRDISERKNQEELEKSQLETERKNALESARLKSNFLATMSHEIRTPINGIIGVNNLMLKTALNDEQKYFSTIINQSATSLLDILNDILDISKIESGKALLEERIFDLTTFLHETLEILGIQARQKGLEFAIEFKDLPDYVLGDSNLLGQVLRNLISNSIKFTEKGAILIEACMSESSKSTTVLEFKVHDSGIGIPKNKLNSIFNSFTQASTSTTRLYGGTGLGLSISKELIKRMKGSISVESTPNVETVFTFTVKFKLPSPAQTSSLPIPTEILKPPVQEIIDSPYKILIVEDNHINQLVVKGLLKKMGQLDIVCAENGQIGLDLVKENEFDIIFMDCQIPVMDGLTATRKIRQLSNGSEIPIIAITANATLAAKADCLKAGMNEYITKPLQEEKLKEIIKRFLIGDSPVTQKDSKPKTQQVDIDFDTTNLSCLEDKELINQVVVAYLDSMPMELDKLERAIKNDNMEDANFIIHSIQGLAGNIGALGFFKNAKSFNQYMKTDGFEGIAKELTLLRQYSQEAANFLKSYPH